MQCRIQRAFLQPKGVLGNLFDVKRDRVAMHRTTRSEALQDEQVQRPLQTVIIMLAHRLAPIASYRRVWPRLVLMSSTLHDSYWLTPMRVGTTARIRTKDPQKRRAVLPIQAVP